MNLEVVIHDHEHGTHYALRNIDFEQRGYTHPWEVFLSQTKEVLENLKAIEDSNQRIDTLVKTVEEYKYHGN